MTWAERELATISALASIEGLAPQLGSHVAGSRNMGLKDDEIHAIPAVLAEKVGAKEACRASQAIAKVFGEEFTEKQPFADMDFPKGQPNSAYAEENPATNGLSLSRMSNMPLAGNNQNQITL